MVSCDITHILQWCMTGIVVTVWPCRQRFPRHQRLSIPTCITARVWRTYRDAYRDRQLAVSFGVGGEEYVPGIPDAYATCNSTYLVTGPSYNLDQSWHSQQATPTSSCWINLQKVNRAIKALQI